MSRPLVIYHANCSDGWCAAWIMERSLGGAELFAAQYGDAPPNVDGRTVFVVDFSYPRKVMEEMKNYAHSLLVLDHHKTAAEDCRDLPYCIFDQNESGATLAYKWCRERGFLYGVEPREIQQGMHSLARYVKDRDLWQWRQDNSAEVNAAIRSYPFDLKVWDNLAMRVHITPQSLTNEGSAILRYRKLLIDQCVSHAASFKIANFSGMACECPVSEIISDVAGKLAETNDFGACWFHDRADVVVSLRSRGDGIDVSELAKRFGGGGHKNAAGFKVKWGELIGAEIDQLGTKLIWCYA